jgi:lysyl-tRNA synthetase class 2
LVKKTTDKLEITYQKQKIDFSSDFVMAKYSELIQKETGIDIDTDNTFEKLSVSVKKADIRFENQNIKVWSELVDELFKKVARPNIIQPTFVVDYPIATTPLAKAKSDNPSYAQRFQLIVAGGFELVNAYSELNDPIEQEKRFRDQMIMKESGWQEAQELDENFIEALKYGMPPTAGWGMGIDRLVMILTDQHSIKEVIPFPTLKPVQTPKPKNSLTS